MSPRNPQQAVLVASAATWKPMRGIHRGIRCSVCDAYEAVMYAVDQGGGTFDYYCAQHRPTLERL